MFKKKELIDVYNKDINKLQKETDKMSNLGREKDYIVQKIEKKFDSKIENCVRTIKVLSIKIDTAKKYISETDRSETPVTKKRV